jgi:hypothetical protein
MKNSSLINQGYILRLHFSNINFSKTHSTEIKHSGVALVKVTQVGNGGEEGTVIPPAKI